MVNVKRVGFIGGGNMATAICKGIINQGIYKPSDVWVSGPHVEHLNHLKDLGINVTNSNGELILNCEIIVISVKPFNLTCAIDDSLNSLKGKLSEACNKLFVSILAGTTLATLARALQSFDQCRIIRIMPNTPMLLGEGASVYCPDDKASEDDCSAVEKILGSCGIYERVPEKLINAVGALSGSGPAFVYLMIEALSDGGVKQGIPRAMATEFAAQTVLGAAKMVLGTKKHPGELKDEVCSAGGSTICGIHALEKGGVRGSYIDAIEAAIKRTIDMEKEN
ncbi:pyrroline 5-carboyxlate reductase isoform X1 [Arctopsyche grandis]|uniref:pyrroline 5-carboyxlate reductase isoform X1 n=1 Tax=Arctopsyche grandis TaxID=121162 RepID=UPI00406D89BA